MLRVSKTWYEIIKKSQDWKCKKCGESIKSGGQILRKDGESTNNRITNLAILCAKCHREIEAKRKTDPFFEI